MWLFTKVGFFSVVELPEDEQEGGPIENRRLSVRARVREDLDALRSHYAPKLGPTLELENRDYPYRAYITKKALAEAMVRVVMDLDYGNFKSKVAQTQGYDRAHLYAGVWSVMNDAERKMDRRIQTAGEKGRQKKLL